MAPNCAAGATDGARPLGGGTVPNRVICVVEGRLTTQRAGTRPAPTRRIARARVSFAACTAQRPSDPQETRRDMGRIFEKRKVTMFRRWDRMAKAFARIGKEIAIAVKRGSADPASNPSLRRVMQNARAANMPKDKVEAAIRRATGAEAVDYQEIVYEGFAPHGIALLVEAATDNPTRTVANIRSHFKAHGGAMGNTGSVAVNFQHMGVFRTDAAGREQDTLDLDLIDHGLEEMREGVGEKEEPQLILHCSFADLGRMQRALEERGIHPKSAGSEYVPVATVELPEDQSKGVLEL